MAHLIVVDDEQEISEIISEIVQEFGHSVRCAKNALQALDMLQCEWADLIITDIIIPIYDLEYLISGLNELTKAPPLLIFSGAPEEVLSKYSHIPILKKPQGFNDLMGKISELLKQ